MIGRVGGCGINVHTIEGGTFNSTPCRPATLAREIALIPALSATLAGTFLYIAVLRAFPITPETPSDVVIFAGAGFSAFYSASAGGLRGARTEYVAVVETAAGGADGV